MGGGSGDVVVEKKVEVEKIVENVGGAVVVEQKTTVTTTVTEPEQTGEQKAKKKSEKLKKTVIDSVNMVMGDSAGKFVESIIEISKHAKASGGIDSLVKSGKLGKLFSQDIVPVLKANLQKKKFPAIVGVTDSPFGDLHYEVSGITLESFDVDPTVQCDITDGSEALQIKLLLSAAKLKNIAWKCGTAKIKEKGTANAEITKGQCVFRISLDKSQGIPRLSIQNCAIELQQFNLELKGGKASWMYNIMTSVFRDKIKTKLKEKIDKVLTKKCKQFEDKINFAANKILSLFSEKKDKGERTIEAPKLTSNKKCFMINEDGDETDCVMLDLKNVTTLDQLKNTFFDELGMQYVAFSAYVRMKFKDRSGTLVTISKSTTIEQIISHAESLHFYKDDERISATPMRTHAHRLSNASSTTSAISLDEIDEEEEEWDRTETLSRKEKRRERRERSEESTSSLESASSQSEISRDNSMVNYDTMYVN